MDRGKEIMQKTPTDTEIRNEKSKTMGKKVPWLDKITREDKGHPCVQQRPTQNQRKRQHRKYVKVKYKREILRDKINLQIKKKQCTPRKGSQNLTLWTSYITHHKQRGEKECSIRLNYPFKFKSYRKQF